MPKESEVVTVNIPLPAETHKKLKKRAVDKGVTLKDLLSSLLVAAAEKLADAEQAPPQ